MQAATTSVDSSKKSFRPDLIAGLTASAIVIPKAMAYATVAGLPVIVGVYTSFVPMVVYGLLGSSRIMSVSTTTTIAILTGAALQVAAPDGDPARLLTVSATLACMAGALLVLAGVFRLGVVANFISDPVLTGFKAGVGLVIVLDQIPKILGVHFSKGNFFQNLYRLAESVPHTSLPTLAVGAGVIVVLIVLEKLWPRLPAPLIALGGAIAASSALGLKAHGIDIVGAIPRGLPRPILPDLQLIREMLPAAAGIALMSFTESIAVGRAFVKEGEPAVRPNRELVATGVANIAGGLLGAMPSGGGTSQSAVVRGLGARSQIASLVQAGVAVLVMLLLAPVIAPLPQAALAAVVIVYSIGLIDPAEFAAIRRIRSMEFRWALTACLCVPIFGTLQGIVLAILVSLLALLGRQANAKVSVLGRKPGTDVFRPLTPEHPEDETFEGLLLVRPEESLFFANVELVREQILDLIKERKPRVIGIDMRIVADVEYSALKAMIAADRRAAEWGIAMWIIGLSPDVLEVVRRSGLAGRMGRERMFFNCQAAVTHYLANPGGAPAPGASGDPGTGS